jgi:hypothetical protein
VNENAANLVGKIMKLLFMELLENVLVESGKYKMILEVVREQVMDGRVTYDQFHTMDFLKGFVIQGIPSVKLAVLTENLWLFEFVICYLYL